MDAGSDVVNNVFSGNAIGVPDKFDLHRLLAAMAREISENWSRRAETRRLTMWRSNVEDRVHRMYQAMAKV